LPQDASARAREELHGLGAAGSSAPLARAAALPLALPLAVALLVRVDDEDRASRMLVGQAPHAGRSQVLGQLALRQPARRQDGQLGVVSGLKDLGDDARRLEPDVVDDQ